MGVCQRLKSVLKNEIFRSKSRRGKNFTAGNTVDIEPRLSPRIKFFHNEVSEDSGKLGEKAIFQGGLDKLKIQGAYS